MVETIDDEMSRLDSAFAGNLLLATFSKEARALIEPQAEIVRLESGDLALQRGEQVAASLFPFGTTMISLVVELSGGRSIEVASIGCEGAVGGIVSCGHAPAFSTATVQVGGEALRIPMDALEDAKSRSGFISLLFCRFSDYLLAQVMQSVACNAYHSIAQRAARWLLVAQDRAGDRIELTQEQLAGLLGVQRTSMNAVVRQLQDDGLVQLSRGAIRVVDRAGLRRRACECYQAVEDHFAQVIGPGGMGAVRAPGADR